MDALKRIPHCHFVFSIPKILRRYFIYDRKLLADLSRSAWESLKVFLREAVPQNDPIPSAVIAMPTFGDFLGYNPHAHVLVTDGCFYSNKGMFRVAPPMELKKLEAIFQHKVIRMLLSKGKITEEMIRMLSTWKHSGFHVFCGNRISPKDDTVMENLARYIIRVSFSQERMLYLDQEGKVVYAAKDGKSVKVFPTMEWLAPMSSHIPNRGEQMVRYYGYYNNVSRRKRQKEGNDDFIPCILEPQGDEKTFRRNWARLIQKIYEVDPLVCPECKGSMRVIRSIEDPSVIRAILQHLGIWLVRSRPPPKIHAPPVCLHNTGRRAAPYIVDDVSQLPINDDHLYRDPDKIQV
ncbi:MAG: transposase [Deltaproteobacteria bacterium]|nr:transposase [Deltaproteobacteria bacterium]